MSTEHRIDSLTGIRGLAALLVVYAHLTEYQFLPPNPLFPGEVAVMLFFTLSGFLMAFLYGEKDFNYTAVAKYGISRFARIAPAYLFVVIGSYLVYGLIDPEFPYTITNVNLLRHLMFSGNVEAFWSIPPEVQFYCVFVALWFALWSFRKHGNAAYLVALLTVATGLIAWRIEQPGTFVGSKIHYFATGVILGLLRARALPGKSMAVISATQATVLVMAVLVASRLIVVDLVDKPHFYNILETALLAGVAIIAFSFDTRLARLLFANKPIMLCGDISFSMYLINIPVTYLAGRLLGPHGNSPAMSLVVAAAILLLSWLIYRTIEMPGSRVLRKLGTDLLLGRVPALLKFKPAPAAIEPFVPTAAKPLATDASILEESK